MKAEPGPALQPIHLRLVVAAPADVSDALQRVKGQGSSVLEELPNQAGFTCLGPDQWMVEVICEHPQPQVAAQPAPQPLQPEVPPPAPVPAQTPVPSQPAPTPTATASAPAPPGASKSSVAAPKPPPSRPTRADRYALEAEERLAKIKEEMADLSTPFKPSGIAATLDEMKEKLVRRVGGLVHDMTSETDQELEREQARKQAEETLARYKQQAEQRIQAAEKEEKEEEEGLKPVKKTLGPASGDNPPSD
jgi:hypothetical protein